MHAGARSEPYESSSQRPRGWATGNQHRLAPLPGGHGQRGSDDRQGLLHGAQQPRPARPAQQRVVRHPGAAAVALHLGAGGLGGSHPPGLARRAAGGRADKRLCAAGGVHYGRLPAIRAPPASPASLQVDLQRCRARRLPHATACRGPRQRHGRLPAAQRLWDCAGRGAAAGAPRGTRGDLCGRGNRLPRKLQGGAARKAGHQAGRRRFWTGVQGALARAGRCREDVSLQCGCR
mmetsp:Transcript_31772/g.80319  ORF Transcript_31772/g.80319 Transcript_31772/m.80319 type:complete len:234 (+) Transcript_31772:745-1446(+)